MIKLRDLLDARRLGLIVLAGDEGLSVWLRCVQVVEDDSPDLIGGELVLTTGRWHRSAADSDKYVAAIAGQGAAALAVAMHRGGVVPADLVAACMRCGLPLVQIPGGVSCESVSEFATTLIVDRRGRALVETLARERALVEAAASPGAGHAALLDVLQRETGSRVWLLTRGAAFYPHNGTEPSSEELSAVGAAVATRRNVVELVVRDSAFALFPVGGRTSLRPRAHLIVAAAGEELSGDLRQAIEQTVLFLNHRFDQQRAVRAFHRRCEDELMRWIASDEATHGSVDGWVRALGIKPTGHVVCLVVRIAHGGRGQELREALDDMADAVDMPRITVTSDHDVGIALLAGHRANDAERAIARLRILLSADPETCAAVAGTSSVIATDVADVTRAFLDARQVCRLNELRNTEPEADPRTDHPLSAILLRIDYAARTSLHAAVLAPLLAYDKEHGSELVHSLDVFLSSNGQWTASAAALNVHVNTLRYRLGRIEEITGRSFGSMADRVDFYVALRSRP